MPVQGANMDKEGGTQTSTLREALEANFDAVIGKGDAPSADAGEAAPAASTPAPAKTEAQPRHEDGTFAPKAKDGAAQAASSKTDGAGVQSAQSAVQPDAAPRPPRPTSWKKEYGEHWDKLDPALAAYLVQREDEYAKGVSTYKAEWDRAKPLLEAIAPFAPHLERFRIAPAQFIAALGNAHQTLALGTPEQKLAMFARLATEYQIPLQQLFVQGQDGKIYFQPPQAPALVQPPQGAALSEEKVTELVKQTLLEQSSAQEVERFAVAAGADGKPLYPHFQAVAATMGQLLDAGLAADLRSAYEAALRMPAHAELYAKDEQSRREAAERQAAEERAKQAQRARKAAVSTPSSTPTAAAKGGGEAKGLRAQLESNFDSIMGQGRV